MINSYITILGFIAGGCTACSFLPQFIKIWRSHATKDISFEMYCIFCLGLVLWIAYGFLVNSLPIIITNGFTLVLALGILIMKILWK